VPITPDTSGDAAARQAHDQSVQALIADPKFAEKYADGDPAARRQWKEIAVDGLAKVLGVDPNASLVGQGPPQATQPVPSAVGSVSTGGAPS
jgi:hypothetical protein